MAEKVKYEKSYFLQTTRTLCDLGFFAEHCHLSDIDRVQKEYKIEYLEEDFVEITALKPSDFFVKELRLHWEKL